MDQETIIDYQEQFDAPTAEYPFDVAPEQERDSRALVKWSCGEFSFRIHQPDSFSEKWKLQCWTRIDHRKTAFQTLASFETREEAHKTAKKFFDGEYEADHKLVPFTVNGAILVRSAKGVKEWIQYAEKSHKSRKYGIRTYGDGWVVQISAHERSPRKLKRSRTRMTRLMDDGLPLEAAIDRMATVMEW